MMFDETDIKILNILQQVGRITHAKLASEVGISPPAMHERVKRLEATGVIEKYVAILDRKKVGLGLIAIISVSLKQHRISNLQSIKERLTELDEVLECYQMTGDVDFFLKVVLEDMHSYTEFINNRLSPISEIQNIKTSFVLDTLKSNTALKLTHGAVGRF